MAREIKTYVWCDACLNDGDHASGDEITVMLDGLRQPRTLALCEVHMDQFIEPLRDMLTQLGQPAHQPEKTVGGSFACLVCGKTYSKHQSLGSHLVRKHGIDTVEEMRKKYAQGDDETLPYDEEPQEKAPPAVTRAECPECDKVYEWPENGRPSQALGIHRRMAHGVKSQKAEEASLPA